MRSRLGCAVIIAMMGGCLILASCSTTPPAPSTSGTLPTDTKPYGSLTLGVNFSTGIVVDAARMKVEGSGTFLNLGGAVFDSLVELTPDGQLRPGIAERWGISPDGMTHTFYIRKGIRFHDGSDLTGADVKFTADSFRVGDPSGSSGIIRLIKSVELKDDYTVVYVMKEPQFDLFVQAGGWPGDLAVVPKKYIEQKGWDDFARSPIGSGPWKVVNFEVNTRLELEAVESHWRAVPKFKQLTLLNIREEATKIAMLKTGELDMALHVSPDSAAGLKAAGLRVVGYYGSSQWYAAPLWDLNNPEKYALADLKVRKALVLAIDRKELSGTIFGGYAQPSAAVFVPTTAYFFDPSLLKPDPYDPDQAKRLLSEAGYPTGFTTKVWDSGAGGLLTTANLALAGFWRKMGVKAEIAPIDFATLIGMIHVRQQKIPDIWNTFSTYISGGALWGFERFSFYHSKRNSLQNINNPRLDELIDKVPMTADPAEKKRLALEAAVMGKNEYNLISGVDVDTLYVFGPKIGSLTPVKGLNGLAHAYETMTHAK